MRDNPILDANRKLKRQVRNKHAEIARLRETLKRVVREARRQHSGVLDEIQERDYLAPCKYCKQPPVVDIDLVPPDGPETTTFIYCGTKGCPNTEEDELESMVMCFEDSQSLWNYRNAPLTNWIAVEIEKERDNALAEVERLQKALDACAAGPWHDVDDPPQDTGEETEYLTECICDDWNPATQEVEPHREITMDIGYDFEAGRWDVDSGVEILHWAEIREPKEESDED